jgi:hypothetical protein
MIVLTEVANEKSSYWVIVNFLDEDNGAMAPDVCTWTLTDMEGNVINVREDVAIVTPELSETLEFSGNDLAVDGNDIVNRLITLEGTYTSDVHGADKPFIIQIQFPVEPAIVV